MKRRINFKYFYFILLFIVMTLSVSVFANGLSRWIFSNTIDGKDLDGSVLVEDIKENYNFVQGTAQNSNTFDKKSSDGSQGVSNYSYKLLGGYTFNSKNKYPLNYATNDVNLTEFNFVTTNTNFVDTAEEGLGRFYYLDKLYITENDSDKNYAYNYTFSYKDDSGNLVTLDKKINLTAKQSVFALSRTLSSDTNKDDTKNWMQVFSQDEAFSDTYGSDLAKNSYEWLQKYVLGRVNNLMGKANLKFYFDHGKDGTDTSINTYTDDLMSFANGSKNHSESSYVATQELTSKESSLINNSLNNKYFRCNTKGYLNVLLFVPFKRNYVELKDNGNVDLTSDNSSYFTALTDENGKYIEEDFGYVAFSKAVDSDNNKYSSFIKIIDFTDATNSTKMPTIKNGGFKLDSNNYFSYSDNFEDDGNLFIDNFTWSGYTRYRRVIGISTNMKSYKEPYIGNNKTEYTLGSTVTTLYSNYPDPFSKNKVNEDEDWAKVLDASSLTEAKSYKLSSTYSLDIDNLMTLDSETGEYKYAYHNNNQYKLIDHLTYEEVDIIPNSYTYTDGSTGEDVTINNGDGKQFGINFNKSMILLLVNVNVSVANTY